MALADVGRGATLVALGRTAEGEPLISAAWPRLVEEGRIASWQKERVRDLVVEAYDTAGNPSRAAEWRKKSPNTGSPKR